MTVNIGRRELLAALGGAVAWPLAAHAQQGGRVPRIGFLYPGAETLGLARIATLREGLRAAGYREPDQVELITRVTGGDPSRVGPMATELIERKVDVLVPLSPAAVQAVRSLTTTIPVVAFDLSKETCPPSPDAWGRHNVVTPFHHLSGDSPHRCRAHYDT